MPIRDLYMRDPSDPSYTMGILEVSNELEILIAEIKMCLYTRRGEVLGAPDLGCNLEDLLFTFNLNEFSINSTLKDQMKKFVPLADKYAVSFQVKFAQGTVRDICVIDILINGTPFFGVAVS